MAKQTQKPPKSAISTEQVRAALKEAAAMKPVHSGMARTKVRASIWWYALGVFLPTAFLVATMAFEVPGLLFEEPYSSVALHGCLALLLTALVLSGKRIADALIDKHTVDDSVTFFNLRLVIRLPERRREMRTSSCVVSEAFP